MPDTRSYIRTKRIIYGMSAKQIADGCVAMHSRVDLEEYLESICKPMPSWENYVSEENLVLCWVGHEPLPEVDGIRYHGMQRWIFRVSQRGYSDTTGADWKHARPISPDECWQPAQRGE